MLVLQGSHWLPCIAFMANVRQQEPEEPMQAAAQPISAADDGLPAVLAQFQHNCIAHALERGNAEPSVYILHGGEPCYACLRPIHVSEILPRMHG